MFFFIEEHDIGAPGEQKQSSRSPTEEETSQTAQRLKPGVMQEQPPPAPVVRPGEQSPPGTHTGEEEEETPEEEAHDGELSALMRKHISMWIIV